VEGMLKMLQRLIGEAIRLERLPRTGLWPIRMDPSQIDQTLRRTYAPMKPFCS